MSSTSGFGDDLGHLVNLSLGTAEGTELEEKKDVSTNSHDVSLNVSVCSEQPQPPKFRSITTNSSRSILDRNMTESNVRKRKLVQVVGRENRMGETPYSLLGQLAGTLVLRVSQQFDHAALIWSETRDFLDDFPDERGAAGQSTLSSGDAGTLVDGGGFLSIAQIQD